MDDPILYRDADWHGREGIGQVLEVGGLSYRRFQRPVVNFNNIYYEQLFA